MPGLPGGPVWTWLESPQPQPGRSLLADGPGVGVGPVAGSLSTMVRTAVLGEPRVAPPVGPLSVRFTVSLPSTRKSSRIGTETVLVTESPSAKLTVMVVAV